MDVSGEIFWISATTGQRFYPYWSAEISISDGPVGLFTFTGVVPDMPEGIRDLYEHLQFNHPDYEEKMISDISNFFSFKPRSSVPEGFKRRI
jgi:hypothetical protein